MSRNSTPQTHGSRPPAPTRIPSHGNQSHFAGVPRVPRTPSRTKPKQDESPAAKSDEKPKSDEPKPKQDEPPAAKAEEKPKSEEPKPKQEQEKSQERTKDDGGDSPSGRRPARSTPHAPHQHPQGELGNPTRRHYLELDEAPKAPSLQVSSRKLRSPSASGVPPPAADSSTQPSTPAARIEAMFRCYCPHKLSDLDSVLAEFRDREETFLQALVIAYGPEPERTDQSRAGHDGRRDAAGPVTVLHSVSRPPQRLPDPGPSQTDAMPAVVDRPHSDGHVGGSGRGYRAFLHPSPKGRTTPNKEPRLAPAHYAARDSPRRHSPSVTPTPAAVHRESNAELLAAVVRRRSGVKTPSMVAALGGAARETTGGARSPHDGLDDSLSSCDVHHSRTSSGNLYPYPRTQSLYVSATSRGTSGRSPSPHRPAPSPLRSASYNALEVHNRRAHPQYVTRF